MDKRTLSAPSRYPTTWHGSPAVAIAGGRTIYIGGVVGARPDGTIPRGDIVAQAELAFASLTEVVVAGGATMADVVKVNVYVSEGYADHAAELRAIRQRYLPAGSTTETVVRVVGFEDPDGLIEVEAIAVIDDGIAESDVRVAAIDTPGGLVLVKPGERIVNRSEQTPGMRRESGVAPETTGSRSLWSGYVVTPGGSVSGAHHHGGAESAIYIVSGTARFRWGTRLEHERIAEPGDFIYVPPRLIHEEENLSTTEPVVFIVSRNSGSMLTVNVDVDACS